MVFGRCSMRAGAADSHRGLVVGRVGTLAACTSGADQEFSGLLLLVDAVTARLRRRFWLKLAAGLLFAVVAYGGAYAVLVVPLAPPSAGVWPDPSAPRFAHYDAFGRSEERARVFCAPAHWIDQRLRPNFWGSDRALKPTVPTPFTAPAND